MTYVPENQYRERADYTWSQDSIRFINTPARSARQTFFYVQEAGFFRTSPPYFTERVNMNSFLVFYTLSGRGLLRYLGESYDLMPGSAAFINCMNPHYYECPSGENWEFLWLHFNGPAALGYYEEFIKNHFRILTELDSAFMEHTLQRILSLTQNRDLHSEILVSGLIVELLTQLLIANSTENLSPGAMPEYLKGILKKLENHFNEPLSLDLLSGEFGVSKYYLSREFKRYMGIPLNEYLIVLRINHAKELLRYSPDMTVEQIAFACGFRHVSHFINLFKRHEKSTPLQYRKSWAGTELPKGCR